MLLALASGLLMTLYSALYRLVKKDIDNSTVLILRGVIQVFFLALLFVTSLKYFFNNFVGLKSNYSLIPVNSWNFWNYTLNDLSWIQISPCQNIKCFFTSFFCNFGRMVWCLACKFGRLADRFQWHFLAAIFNMPR